MTEATTTAANAAVDYAHANRDTFLKGFMELLAIPSVSTDLAYKADIERCADWVVAEMTRIGLRNARKIATDGHPVIYGEWLDAGADKPTVLIYAHYDVQPIDPIEAWETPPFEPSVREGRLYARGAADDKCGVWGTLKTLEAMFGAHGTLPVNVKMFYEGEEETGSPNMEAFVTANKDLLKADIFILCDGGFDPEKLQTTYALRGIAALEVTVTGPGRDLHSGEFGGAVHNPLHMIGKIIGSFHDDSGRIQIPGYYDAVRGLTATEKTNLDAIWEPRLSELQERTGVKRFWAESLGSFAERVSGLPTLEVNGVWGGYQGEGTKTVIPSVGGFKITTRLVPDQNPQEIARKVQDYVESFATDTVTITTKVLALGWPVTLDFEGPIANALNKAYQTTVGTAPVWIRSGGSIPIGGMFQHALTVPLTSLGFGAGDNYHAPNEYVRLDDFFLAVDTLIHLLYNLAETA